MRKGLPLSSDLALLCSNQGPDVTSTILKIAPDSIFERYLDDHDYPMIYQAAKSGSTELLSFLLGQEMDIEASDPYGWRALHIACYHGYKKVV